ncbi:MAG: hypothetical protein AAGA60_06270 [Cyanobacteria bacterium P01_E01_bin.42]
MAYLLMPSTEAEEWIAEIDTARDRVIEALDLEKKWQISLYDLFWCVDMVYHQAIERIRLLVSDD